DTGTVFFFTAFVDAAGIECDVAAKFVETGLAYFGIGEALGADGGVEGILKRIIRDYVTGLSRPEFVDGVGFAIVLGDDEESVDLAGRHLCGELGANISGG